jgi:hypothetical protein
MDKALSIVTALAFGFMMILLVWLLSSHSPDLAQKSLATGLTAMGGPTGFWGGCLLVAAVVLAMYGLHELVNLWMGRSIIEYLRERGRSDARIAAQLDTMPISRGLKRRLREHLAHKV